MSDVDAATAAVIHASWDAGATMDELAKTHGMSRQDVRQVVFSRQIARGGPSAELVPVGGPTSEPVVDGELVAVGAEYLPAHWRGDGPPPGAPQDVIDNWLTPSAKRLILRGKSEHTIKAYMQGFGWWVKFARANSITVMPAPQNGMIRQLDWWEQFPVHIGCAGRSNQECNGHRPSPSAVWIWFSAMKWFHGLGEPPMPWEGGVKLTDAIAGYIKQLKDDGWRRTSAPRAFPDDVRYMIDALDAMGDEPPPGWDEGGLTDKPEDDDVPVWFAPARRDMLRALILLAFYTGGRASDLARYRINDINRFPGVPATDTTPGSPGGLQLTLARSKGSKGDRNEEFRTVFHDLDHPQYDGVLAVERWVARLNGEGIFQGALMRPVHKSGTIVRGGPDAISYMADVTGLSRAVRWVAKAAWQRSGKTVLRNWRDFTIHALRRGRVQQLLEQEGVDVFDVETELGWAHGGAIKFYRAEVQRQNATAANARGML